ASLGLTVPPTVFKLLTEESRDDAINVLAEVRAERDGPAIDARLDLAIEEPLAIVLLAAAVAHASGRAAHALVARIDPELLQQLEDRQRRDPGLSLLRDRVVDPARREARALGPLAVLALEPEEPCAPAFVRDARAFRGD